MFQLNEPMYNLKNEMEARKYQQYKNIIGSIVCYPTQRQLNHEISNCYLEDIDIGPKIIISETKKDTLLQVLNKIIEGHDVSKPDIPKIKFIQKREPLKIETDFDLSYLSESDFESNITETSYEKNVYFKKYKQCSPIKRNSEKSYNYKGFSMYENEETRL